MDGLGKIILSSFGQTEPSPVLPEFLDLPKFLCLTEFLDLPVFLDLPEFLGLSL